MFLSPASLPSGLSATLLTRFNQPPFTQHVSTVISCSVSRGWYHPGWGRSLPFTYLITYVSSLSHTFLVSCMTPIITFSYFLFLYFLSRSPTGLIVSTYTALNMWQALFYVYINSFNLHSDWEEIETRSG